MDEELEVCCLFVVFKVIFENKVVERYRTQNDKPVWEIVYFVFFCVFVIFPFCLNRLLNCLKGW